MITELCFESVCEPQREPTVHTAECAKNSRLIFAYISRRRTSFKARMCLKACARIIILCKHVKRPRRHVFQ